MFRLDVRRQLLDEFKCEITSAKWTHATVHIGGGRMGAIVMEIDIDWKAAHKVAFNTVVGAF